MPIHDWTGVDAGLFHHFRLSWTVALCDVLNTGGLPSEYFALMERTAPQRDPVLFGLESPTGITVMTTPPPTRFVHRYAVDPYVALANRIAIRDRFGHVVAVIEVVSTGTKSSRHALNTFVAKVINLLNQGIQVLIVDLFPPSKRDPQRIHGAIWRELDDEPVALPPDKPLTVVAYTAGPTTTAYVEPLAVGDALPDMPLFLQPEAYVPTPLEATYETAWLACPAALREEVTAQSAPDGD